MGKKWKQWQIFFLGSKTQDGDFSNDIKRHMLLGRKAMTNLDSVLKSRDTKGNKKQTKKKKKTRKERERETSLCQQRSM